MQNPTAASTFRRSLPVTLTSFINKAGTIGLSIIPIILVERHFSNDQSAWIMGSIKAAGLLGILLGGWSCDLIGLRKTLLLSFLISGVGLTPLPFFDSALLIALMGCVAQLGTSLYYASARLLITQMVAPGQRREAIAWQRTANNFAQIISFTLGAALGRFGTAMLTLFDAATSFFAAAIGSRILPASSASDHSSEVIPPTALAGAAPTASIVGELFTQSKKRTSRRDFYQCALIIASFSFLYDLYSVAAAAQCKILFGAQGLEVFSEVMVINTILCALLSVYAARHLINAATVLPAGLMLVVLGLLITFGGNQSRMAFFMGSFVLTLGEIVFNSLAGLVLIHIAPPGARQGSTYSNGVLIQFIGRIAGGSLAFPLLIGSAHPLTWIAVSAIPTLALGGWSRPLLLRIES